MFVLFFVWGGLWGLVFGVALGLRCGLVGACCGVEWLVIGVLSQIVLSQEAFLSQSVFLSQGTVLSQAGFLSPREGSPVTCQVRVSATMIPVTNDTPGGNGGPDWKSKNSET